MDEALVNYLKNNLPPVDQWVRDMEEVAKEENIPIMDPLSMNFLMQLIRLKKPARILEIGTAIGYSALRMSEAHHYAEIVTIERDKHRYNQAIDNIKKYGDKADIQVIFGDAMEKLNDLPSDKLFDMVFIDAAKGQYKHFFELSRPLLTENGFIVSDNVLFKGFVAEPETDNKRLKKIAGKIRDYNDWLIQQPDFFTTIIPIGDGVAISSKSN
ncbi:O-methyltransferase [Virgibacillus kekensis]|uniref:tRNA 5-hydroxyuridine methyltransferase n=1 Tax=Virgibacillus kekensis TaxID=202261 RepID=A0ABV9DJ89_9BACI